MSSCIFKYMCTACKNPYTYIYEMLLFVGTIAQVLKNGYKLKDRVLRPAQVGTIA